MSHDQNFKNLILDYPREAIAFFAAAEAAALVSATGGGDAGALYRRSSGNPLHLRMLATTGGSEETLASAIDHYLAGLPGAVRDVLGHLCVFEPLSRDDLVAIAGEDANWGRIVMAVGKSGEYAERDKLAIWFGGVRVAFKGLRDPAYDEAEVSRIMQRQEIVINVDLGVGDGAATVWTCDLTKEYVAINGDYRS